MTTGGDRAHEQYPWQVWILGPGGRIQGGGVLLSDRLVLTRMHLIPPDGKLRVGFAGLDCGPRSATVLEDEEAPDPQYPSKKGFPALIVLDEPVAGARGAPLGWATRDQELRVRFPSQTESGTGEWVEGVAGFGPSTKVRLMRQPDNGPRSPLGCGVIEAETGRVVGIIAGPFRSGSRNVLPLGDAALWQPALRTVLPLFLPEGPHEHFAGRHAALAELSKHFFGNRYRFCAVRAVTGDPGSGKSALLRRLAAVGPPNGWAGIPQGPSGSVAVNAAGRTVAEITEQIGEALAQGRSEVSRRLASSAPTGPQTLLGALRDPPRYDPDLPVLDELTLIVADGVDEAADPKAMLDSLIGPLASDPYGFGVLLIVGCGRELAERLTKSSRAPLQDFLKPAIIDLDDPAFFDPADVAACVTGILSDADRPGTYSGYRDRPDLAATVAGAVAAAAGTSFLTARLAAAALRWGAPDTDRPDWQDALPRTPGEAVDAVAARAGAIMRERGLDPAAAGVFAMELLAPLGYVYGDGLSDDDTWARAATELGTAAYTAGDVAVLRERTPAAVLVDHDSGWHLAHATLGAVVRADHESRPGSTAARAHEAITTALIAGIPERAPGVPDWTGADGYTRSFAAAHAAQAGRPDLVANLADMARPAPLAVAEVVWSASHRADTCSAGTVGGRPVIVTTAAIRWSDDRSRPAVPKLTAWTIDPDTGARHELLTVADGGLHAATAGLMDNRPIAVCVPDGGPDDRRVCVLDLTTRKWAGRARRRIEGKVTSVVLAAAAGQTFAVVTRSDSEPLVLELHPARRWSGAHAVRVAAAGTLGGRSIAVGELGGSAIAVTAPAVGSVLGWNLATRKQFGLPVPNRFVIRRVALGLQDKHLIVLIGGGRSAQVWEMGFNMLRGAPITDLPGDVTALAVGACGDQPVALIGCSDGTLCAWDMTDRDWEAISTGDPSVNWIYADDHGLVVLQTGTGFRGLKLTKPDG